MTRRDTLEVTLKTVATEEELADVSADVVFDHKAAARMLVDEFADVKY